MADPSKFEYTLKDSALTAISLGGARFQFSKRLKEHNANPNGESTRGRGSGATMVYHTGVIYDHQFSFAIPIDEADLFDEWFNAFCLADGVCHIERKRSKPRQKTVTDMYKNYLPIRGEEAFAEGDATYVTYEGGNLDVDRDVTGAITA